MGDRIKLQALLEKLLGSKNVYYMPPESLKINYPAIVYRKSGFDTKKADNRLYSKKQRYDLTVIDRRPDNLVIEKLMELPYCSYDRQYTSDNLQHDSLTLYY